MAVVENVENVDKVVSGTRLVQMYGGRLKDWADELQRCSDTIVAISRKGPRLIELMVREGFLSESVLSRVIAEQALPFLTQNDNPGFVIVDDAITYGTTFNRIYKLTERVNIRCGGDSVKPMGIPFAVGKEANNNYLDLAAKHFLDLEPDQIASFVHNELLAFRLLGKPYDIEHPMLTWVGDFTDTIKLEVALEQITELLDGQKINIDTSVPTVDGNVTIRRWSILLPTDSPYYFYQHVDYKKLRIYLNPEKDRLLVAAMCPFSLSKADMDSLGEILPKPLNHLWKETVRKIETGMIDIKACKTGADEELVIASNRSLAMWANFLLAMVLLRNTKAVFLEAFENAMLQTQILGPRREDLQYLIGPAICFHAESSLAHFLDYVDADSTPASYPFFDHAAEVKGEKIPQHHEEDYKEKLTGLIYESLEVNDVLQAIFYAQHTEIEIISRNESKDNNDDYNRLEFGITYGKLRQMVLDRFPNTTEIDIHECLDKLIDNGAIVPRYMNMATLGNPEIWVRTFRVGEATVKQGAHTVRLLFEKLSEALETKELPPLVFEKYCALALCGAKDISDLRPLDSLGIKKSFHIYGARPALMQGKKQEFLMDWAVSQKILSRSKSAVDIKLVNTELEGNYILRQDIEKLYPRDECHWDVKVKDGLEDLAGLVTAIHKKYNYSYLVALTSVATKRELQQAIEAELELWLYDHSASVYKGLAKLNWLAEEMVKNTPTEWQLKDVNTVLYKMANFTAQVDEKIKLEKSIVEIYEEIDVLVATDKLMKRCWRDLRKTLDIRHSSELASSNLEKIKSTLRIAHVATRILRELLNLAGLKDKRSVGLEESLDRLQVLLNDPEKVDAVIMRMFAATASEPSVATLIAIAKNHPIDNFIKAFPKVSKLIIEIADRCERILQIYGISQQNEKEQPVVLPIPHYIMMWDIMGSTKQENRNKIELSIIDANRLIKETLGHSIKGFNADSKDDANSFACEKFKDVLDAFKILSDFYCDYPIRAGCEVNLLGQLNYYPKSKSFGGRAFEYAARVRDFFSEIKSPGLWTGNPGLSEPADSYMVVSEFAKRFAQKENTWPENKAYKVEELVGIYKPRINDSFPMSLTILQLEAFELKG